MISDIIIADGGYIMDQIKIGKFIAERRKMQGLTQLQLAEQLGITDRAVSKWETGRAMPDCSIMLPLCDTLGITVNDLLCAEVVTMENYNKTLEENLIKMAKQKEAADKRLLLCELLFGIISIAVMLTLCMIASYAMIDTPLRIVLIIVAIVPLLVAVPFLIRIEQTAGYYECAACGHRYVPDYRSVFMSSHIGTTRHMRCPRCHRKSWQKKVISKDE